MSERERSAGRAAATAASAPSSSRLPGTPSDGDLPGLLELVGHLLEAHSPDRIAVLLREELDRREVEAYAMGWRDAAAEYAPALEEALAAAATRPLRLVDRTPGQAAVIPFPQDFQSPSGRSTGHGGHGGHGGPVDTGEGRAAERERAGGRTPRAHRSRTGVPDGDGEEAGDTGQAGQARRGGEAEGGPEGGAAAQPRPQPGFAAKSRKSKVPTIPPLGTVRRPPREPEPPAETPPGDPPAGDPDHPGP
ncbi:hypothetical protein [Streptomyces tsukubensis]|uniref:Uncharacterized protein n=1 Tax=Streptomyces tsukubensis (strain DSM 42081 / NBRC 108919 / NRRL 18488 / 9993) TaxID=1114943 RepID=A0A7G3UES8_STRT9|nr:hypothetical protein [Streptomyces tsukubensis]AZK95940.1 hypothetical protein B7R87_20285 [Streptomyces tsukubensis]QKM68041.1 hypothetical protein STSU_013500 [Streptomyces tsukubensis NRRL18488]TAI44441.1 hypothetical protein EWI31_13295 [Streptomyces tsukubensis]